MNEYWHNVALAGALAVFMCSLAGLPISIGLAAVEGKRWAWVLVPLCVILMVLSGAYGATF